MGEILQSRGVKFFYHPEQDNYRFFVDAAHPELNTVHRIQWVMENTDQTLFGWQIDVLHNWSGRVRFLNATTHQPDISVWALAQAERRRVMGWHIKDGFRNTAQQGTWVGGPPESGGSPYFQTFARTPTFTDTVVSGEGDLGAGPGPDIPNADPDCPGFKYMFENLGGHQRPLHHRERQRPRPSERPERRSRQVTPPREGVRGRPAGLARRKVAAGRTRLRTAGVIRTIRSWTASPSWAQPSATPAPPARVGKLDLGSSAR